MKLIDQDRIDRLCDEARRAERKRAHDCLHPVPEDAVQRMMMALQPGTYVRPHRHLGDDKWESLMILQGRLGVLAFNHDGQVSSRVELHTGQGPRLIEYEAGTWHTLVALAPDTVVFEFKRGPFIPLDDKNFARWAPAEGEDNAAIFEQRFRTAQAGDYIATAISSNINIR